MVNEKKYFFLAAFFIWCLPTGICMAGEQISENNAYLSLIESVEHLPGVTPATVPTNVPGPLSVHPGIYAADARSSFIEYSGSNKSTEARLGELYEHTWGDLDFLWYFVFGNGKAVDLADIGLLDAIKNSRSAQNAKDRFGLQIYDKFKSLVPVNATTDFTYAIERSYGFKDVMFSIGDATLTGTFKGKIWRNERHGYVYYSYRGEADINFSDRFTDPGDVVEITYGHSKPPDWLEHAGNGFVGTAYNVIGSWKWSYSGPVRVQ